MPYVNFIKRNTMKKIYIILLLLGLTFTWFSCDDDDAEVFEVDITDLQLSFSPYAGGAILNYTLPANSDIYALKVRYENEFGEQVTRQGTYTNNSIDLSGFANAQEQVPVNITLSDAEGVESKTITKYFSTDVSPTVQLFEDITVNPYWDGFSVTIPAIEDENARGGRLNIYYVGTNPVTQEIDTLFAFDPYPLQAYADTLLFTQIDDTAIEDVSVVIKSEDSRGHFVRKEVYENIKTPHPRMLKREEFVFSTKAETETKDGYRYEFHEDYLFDGDKKGETCFYGQNADKLYTYQTIRGEEFNDETNVFSITPNEAQGLAWVRFYAPLNVQTPNIGSRRGWPFSYFPEYAPTHVIVYGAPSVDAPESEWVQLAEAYHTLEKTPEEEGMLKSEYYKKWWWYRNHNHALEKYFLHDKDAFEEAVPCYLQINCPVEQEEKYACFKIRVKETFNQGTYKYGVIAMHELEIFVRGQ
jgi:hypothetical protein